MAEEAPPSFATLSRENARKRQSHAMFPAPLAAPIAQVHPAPGSVYGDVDIADFIEPDCYYSDPPINMEYERAIRHFQGTPRVFRTGDGRRVSFESMDWFVQCGMLTSKMRPIDDKQDFAKAMGSGPAVRDGHAKNRVDEDIADDNVAEKRKDSAQTSEPECGQTATETTATEPSTPASAKSGRKGSVHEVLMYSDEMHTVLVRREPGIKASWHPSKSRVSHSQKLFDELDWQGACSMPPRLRARGGLGSTLAKSPPLGLVSRQMERAKHDEQADRIGIVIDDGEPPSSVMEIDA